MQTNTMGGIGRKAVSVVAAATLAFGIAVPASLATADDAYAVSVDGYVTAAAYRAAEPAPEILGLSGVGTNTAWTGLDELDWSAPVHYIMGTAEYNSNPNPYMVNTISGETPGQVYDSRQGGPTAAMYPYDPAQYADNSAVWDLLPDVIIGTGNGVDYSDAAYAPAAGAANGVTDYDPIGVSYRSTDVYTMIDTMYDIAAAGDQVAAETGKSLRYGSATDIAKDYERYVRGTQGYILQRLAQDGADQKTVALVNNYDAASGTYSIACTGVEEGTAAANRYLEATQNVAVNLADTLAEDGAEAVSVTPDQLASVDLIMLGYQATQEGQLSIEEILATFSADMTAKAYWVGSENGSAGSCYGVTMNSVENAQNTGRILGCLYPEYIDQDNWVAYYYDNFYHINDGKLGEAIDNAMDGVRNWDSTGDLTTWTADDAADYNAAEVAADIQAGCDYIAANEASLPALLALSDNLADDEASFPDVVADQWYTPFVEQAVELGLMGGRSDTGLFGIGTDMTRAEALTVLYRAATGAAIDEAYGADETPFEDVEDNAWYTNAVNWAYENQITTGTSETTFEPDAPITREMIATYVWRVAGEPVAADTSVFDAAPDRAEVSAYAVNALQWTACNDILSGDDNTRELNPGDNALREQAAKIFVQAYDFIA